VTLPSGTNIEGGVPRLHGTMKRSRLSCLSGSIKRATHPPGFKIAVFRKFFLYNVLNMQNNRTRPVPAPRTEDNPRPAIPISPVRVKGAVSDILLALAITFLPLAILTAVLLGIIFHYRVVPNNYSILQLPQGSESSYGSFYLVDFSATRLITVASWSSGVAPLLPGFVMTLLSYPAGKRILKASEDESAVSLMTPFQLSLFISSLKGGIGPLWKWSKYLVWRRGGSLWEQCGLLLRPSCFLPPLGEYFFS
jgi:hypothetical protein